MKRIGNSFKGIAGGFILILIGIVLLWWNEGNNVKNIKTTAEMEKVVIDVKSDKVNSKNDGKLIATNGELINEQELTDDDLGVTIKTPKMIRVVEVYQWDENSTTDDDGHTTYSYRKKWSDDLIDSGNFHDKNKKNPTTKLFENKTYTSSDVKVGAFSLSSNQIERLSTKANFNYLAPDIYVSDAIHKSHIELSESGTKAAAVTIFTFDKNAIIEKTKETINISFNKPFLYLIKEKNNNNIWFAGIVYEPMKFEDNTCDDGVGNYENEKTP